VDAPLDRPAPRLLQAAHRPADLRVRQRFLQAAQGSREPASLQESLLRLRQRLALEQLLGGGEALQLLERMERARIHRVERSASRALEPVDDAAPAGQGGDEALDRARAELREGSDLEERHRADESPTRAAHQQALPVLALT